MSKSCIVRDNAEEKKHIVMFYLLHSLKWALLWMQTGKSFLMMQISKYNINSLGMRILWVIRKSRATKAAHRSRDYRFGLYNSATHNRA